MKLACRLPALAVHLLAAALTTACASAHVVSGPAPAPVAGDRIRYTVRPDSTDFVVARAISVDADSLIFERLVPDVRGSGRHWVRESLSADTIARLQVRVGRRGNVGRGALIGGLVGVALGVACASEEPGWFTPSPGECVVGYTVAGLGTGALVGALIRSDVWAPTRPPARRQAQPPAPPVVSAAAPARIGIRIPIRLMSR